MNRRNFMRTMFGLTVTIAVNPTIVIADPLTAYGKLREMGFGGIPYHLNDATVGSWMGLPRNSLGPLTATLHAEQHKEYVKLIRKMLEDAMKQFASDIDKEILKKLG